MTVLEDELYECLGELVDMVQDALDGNEKIDSFTLQPARNLLERIEDGSYWEKDNDK